MSFDEQEHEANREKYNKIVRGFFDRCHELNTTIKVSTVPLPTPVKLSRKDAEYVDETLQIIYDMPENSGVKAERRKVWEILNDPYIHFDSKNDGRLVMGLCLAFWATIIFVDEKGQETKWTINFPEYPPRITIFMRVRENGLIKVQSKRPRLPKPSHGSKDPITAPKTARLTKDQSNDLNQVASTKHSIYTTYYSRRPVHPPPPVENRWKKGVDKQQNQPQPKDAQPPQHGVNTPSQQQEQAAQPPRHEDVDRGAPAWQPPPERERRGAPSAASEAFLEKRHIKYVNALLDNLRKALKLENNEKYKGVYTAYKDAFGQMLSETQAHCFTGKTFEEPAEGDVEQATPKKPSWMQLQAAENVTKARWLLVLKESNALWHAVVVKFRALYQNFNLRGEFQDVRVSEEEQYADGASIPAHHISDLRILCGRNFVDVARGRWSAYIRKEFATNTVHFLREYQTRLMERFATRQEKLFGFWFYPSDLCDWVRDIREAAALKNAPAEARAQGEAATRVADRSAAKRFRWPACCKKGNNLQDADSITTPAYKAFCQQNGLWSQSRNSRLQFCQRMRAAWLRVVDAYEFQDGEPPSVGDIITYLNKQKIFEVRLEKNAAGRMSAVDEVVYILKDPARHTTKELRAEMPTRRVLVYGAPLVNPYLCGPRL